jgi:hypothetical protein
MSILVLFFASFSGSLCDLCGKKLLTAKTAKKIRKGRKETYFFRSIKYNNGNR